jgi:DNA replication licensing factor MCM4
MRLSQLVEEGDVKEAISLMEAATLKTATDPSTGIVNLDIITTGKSAAIRKREEEIADRVQALITANKANYKNATTFEKLE